MCEEVNSSLQINDSTIIKVNPISEGYCKVSDDDQESKHWEYKQLTPGTLNHAKIGTRCILEYTDDPQYNCKKRPYISVVITDITIEGNIKTFTLAPDPDTEILC